MNKFQQEIYKTIDFLIEQKLKSLRFDITEQGKVLSIEGDYCKVGIRQEEYNCLIPSNLSPKVHDNVYVVFPKNNAFDKFICAIL